MEFPLLGKNCEKSECKILDFLPFKCDCCHKVFWYIFIDKYQKKIYFIINLKHFKNFFNSKEHVGYTAHNCDKYFQKDFKVPVWLVKMFFILKC